MDRRQLILAMLSGSSVAGIVSDRAVAQATVSARDNLMRRQYIDSPYGQLYTWTAGQGPNVLLVHQSGNSTEEFSALVPLLADQFRLIAVDLPGHGRSDDPRAEPTVDDYTIALEAALAHYDVRHTHVVGHHGGALAAMNLAARNPDMIGKAILSGTGAPRSQQDTQAYLKRLQEQDNAIKASQDYMGDLWAFYVDMLSDGGNVTDLVRPFIATLDGRLRPYRGIVTNVKWDRREALAKLRGPVLLLQGSKDNYVGGQEALLEIIPNSERQVLAGCGTFMFYDRPQTCAAVIARYLSSA